MVNSGWREMIRAIGTRGRALRGLAVLLLALITLPSRAFCQDVDVRAMLQRGVALRREGHDRDALVEFRRAYELTQSPVALAQIGLAEQALQEWSDAERDIARAISLRGDPWIVRHSTELQTALQDVRGHLASAQPSSEPSPTPSPSSEPSPPPLIAVETTPDPATATPPVEVLAGRSALPRFPVVVETQGAPLNVSTQVAPGVFDHACETPCTLDVPSGPLQLRLSGPRVHTARLRLEVPNYGIRAVVSAPSSTLGLAGRVFVGGGAVIAVVGLVLLVVVVATAPNASGSDPVLVAGIITAIAGLGIAAGVGVPTIARGSSGRLITQSALARNNVPTARFAVVPVPLEHGGAVLSFATRW
jgi:hypothetical protein